MKKNLEIKNLKCLLLMWAICLTEVDPATIKNKKFIADLKIIMDKSVSISKEYFNQIKEAVSRIINRINVNDDNLNKVKIYMTAFVKSPDSRKAVLEKENEKNDFSNYLDDYIFNESFELTKIVNTLKDVEREFALDSGPKFLLMFSDGFFDDDELSSIRDYFKRFSENGVEIFVLTSASHRNMEILGEFCDRKNLLSLKNLDEIFFRINDKTIEKSDANLFTAFEDLKKPIS